MKEFVALGRETAWRLKSRLLGRKLPSEPRDVGAIVALAGNECRRLIYRHPGVVVLSRPKSGRTWLRFMLDQLGVHLAYSHAETGPLPNWLDQLIIFLHRDPRDVLVSTWFELRFRADQSEIDFADLFGCPRHGLEAIVDFNLLWAAEVSEARGSLALSYETMMADPAATLERTLVWLGVERCDEAIRRAVEAGRFERMRELETSGQGARLYGAALAPFDSARPDSFKTRRGGSGSWREHFSAEQAVMAERILAERDYWVRMSAGL